ncbi:hypothetical protein LTR36_005502 [Oleoguttula mirabilis]|uniref:Amino acid permease n=1 Tax=Oleoguttula mirabilis TaxID=1507867 RepID=A0AAV9JEY7_9PEZI|nr:hypothetical protein LTR36_005502 [Oleoguttula mirabilis]
MVWSYLVNAPLTFILAITLCFNIGSVEAALDSTHPVVWIFHNALHNVSATNAFTAVLLVLMAMIAVSNIATASRQMFAFARDSGLPYSKFLKRINPRHRVPLNAILVTAGVTIILSVINMSSEAAFNTVLSLSTAALMASYIISIGCILRKRLRSESLPYARW